MTEVDSTEEWRPVLGYEGRYEVSSLGRVRSEMRGLMSPGRVPGRGPYLRVTLTDGNGFKRCRMVHVLVLEAFRGSRPTRMQTRHLNGDGSDNRIQNLAWGTPAQNGADKVRHGASARGVRAGNAKLTEAQARCIRDAVLERGGVTRQSIADCFGVSIGLVKAIRRREAWGWMA